MRTALEPLASLLLLPLLCGAATAALLMLLQPLLQRYALARPSARSSHKTPTPQGAGIAVVLTSVAGALVLSPHGSQSVLLVMAAVILIALVGGADDLFTLPVVPRLALQAVAVRLVVFSLPDAILVFPSLPLALERGLLLLAGLWFVNLTNFMDGLDWLTVAQFVPVSIGLALAASIAALPYEALVTSLALLGAMIGFAPFNKPVARMFLGDVGSLAIGLLAGWLLVLLAGSGHFAAALLLPLYSVADATITLFRRLAKREPVWQAHRTHFYQQATDRGFTVLRVVTLIFCLNVALTALAILTIAVPTFQVAFGAIIAGAAPTALLLYCFATGRWLRG